jgi:hypothetical protein
VGFVCGSTPCILSGSLVNVRILNESRIQIALTTMTRSKSLLGDHTPYVALPKASTVYSVPYRLRMAVLTRPIVVPLRSNRSCGG